MNIPDLYAKIKDHKETVEGDPTKVRAVCGALESPNGQLSNILSDIVNALTGTEDKHNTECRSSEQMRAGVKTANSTEGDEERVIGSSDFVSYYTKLNVRKVARIVGKMAEDSELDIKTDNKEMGLFLASTLTSREHQVSPAGRF